MATINAGVRKAPSINLNVLVVMLVIIVSSMDTKHMLFSGRKSYQLGLQSRSICLLSAVRIIFNDLEGKSQKRFFSGPSAEIT